jgi:hypothetical protein
MSVLSRHRFASLPFSKLKCSIYATGAGVLLFHCMFRSVLTFNEILSYAVISYEVQYFVAPSEELHLFSLVCICP